MVATYTRDFEVTWEDPADGEQAWLFDRMHTPTAMCGAVAEFWTKLQGRYMGTRTMFVNGHAYHGPVSLPEPSEDILRRGILDVWTNDFLPEVTKACEGIRRRDYASMTATELADALPQIIEDGVHAFGFTMRAVTGFMGPTFGFLAYLQGEIGNDAPRLAATMLQGFENGTAAAGAGLSELAELAAQHPALGASIRSGDVAAIEAAEGGAAFMARLRAYLDNFGWRVDSWGMMDRPTWAEDPALPLALIAHYISDPARAPRAAHERSSVERDQTVREVEARIAPEKLGQFREMLATVQAHVPVSEGRALWQLIVVGSLRVPYLALGQKLVEAGALERADHVFHFNSDELREGARQPSDAFKAEGARRAAELIDWRTLTPPPFIGAPPDTSALPEDVQTLLTLFFGVGVPEVRGKEITGQAASKGVVTGTARVLRDLGEASRLQPGDILVCATTAPPWTPLFAIAAAVVTDSGGVLSHSAICAREYAIPCVVATQVATQLIPDGATITVDGTNGKVRIEG